MVGKCHPAIMGRVSPQMKAMGKEEGNRARGRAAQKKGRKGRRRTNGGEGPALLSFTKEGGNRVEEKKEKQKSLQPLRRAARTGRGEHIGELTASVEAKSLFFRKEAQCDHPGSLRNP